MENGSGISAQSIQNQLPYYLTQKEKEGLAHALANWPNPIQYYISGYDADILQGDSWTHLPIRRFETGEKLLVNGVVLSNTCDIAPENPRAIPPKAVVCPLVRLDHYVHLLEKASLSSKAIGDKVKAIRAQRITNIFYLPDVPNLSGEHITVLDDVYSVPTRFIEIGKVNRKLFTLHLVGFYLFVLKLSAHFCRLHEQVKRTEENGSGLSGQDHCAIRHPIADGAHTRRPFPASPLCRSRWGTRRRFSPTLFLATSLPLFTL